MKGKLMNIFSCHNKTNKKKSIKKSDVSIATFEGNIIISKSIIIFAKKKNNKGNKVLKM
jgi:hypothetical protein